MSSYKVQSKLDQPNSFRQVCRHVLKFGMDFDVEFDGQIPFAKVLPQHL